MMTLLWKDLRVHRRILLSLVGVFVFLPIIFFALLGGAGPTPDLSGTIAFVDSPPALAGCTIIMAFLGSAAFAKERRDGSAEFVASFPVSRWRVVLSKVAVGLFLALLPWTAVIAAACFEWGHRDRIWEFDGLMAIACVQAMVLGVSWLLSSLFRSDRIAALATLVGMTSMVIAYFAVWQSLSSRRDVPAINGLSTLGYYGSWSVGISSFALGTIIALRRRSL